MRRQFCVINFSILEIDYMIAMCTDRVIFYVVNWASGLQLFTNRAHGYTSNTTLMYGRIYTLWREEYSDFSKWIRPDTRNRLCEPML